MYVTSSYKQYIYIHPTLSFMIKKLNHDSGGRTSLNIPRSIRRKQLEQRKAKKTHQEKRREREREREKGVDQRKPKGLMITAMEME